MFQIVVKGSGIVVVKADTHVLLSYGDSGISLPYGDWQHDYTNHP